MTTLLKQSHITKPQLVIENYIHHVTSNLQVGEHTHTESKHG